ncbi:MAG: TRAP transporter large permease subunit, partial [Hyphomicrobiales bacterium]|nr:TRAP transporter large permease subunit [Hyphomicrobiales bacterium]
TEAAAVAALVAILIAFATRAMDFRGFLDALLETTWTTGMLFVIVIGAFFFSYFIALTQLPNEITTFFKSLNVPPFVIILMMVAFYIGLGFFLDAISMILITVPVFLPLAEGIGYDGIWFGILVLVSVEIGMITPPVGLNIFVIKGQMPEIELGQIYRGVIPFLFAHLALIFLLMVLPSIATWLPAVLY